MLYIVIADLDAISERTQYADLDVVENMLNMSAADLGVVEKILNMSATDLGIIPCRA
jgi:hypothetical protein